MALIGTRGIPARYGGFETFAEQLSTRLVARGHSVTVYGRRKFGEKVEANEFDGVRVRYTPTVMHKYLETPLSSLTAFLDALKYPFDIVLLCNAANSPFAFIPRLKGTPLMVNVDGIERHRTKWNTLGKLWYRLGEITSVLFASRVIADAKVISDYYRSTYKTDSTVIPYGTNPIRRVPGKVMEQFGLKPGEYILYVSRLEPENNALGVIEAYCKSDRRIPLVIVGDAPYADEYKALLRSKAGPGVIFTGFQFGEAYQELQSNCYIYIQATEVGGTHPALIEAMSYGNCVIANGTPENIEVVADTAYIYQKNDFNELSSIMTRLLASPDDVKSMGVKARDRAERCYSWDSVVEQYEDLAWQLIAKPGASL